MALASPGWRDRRRQAPLLGLFVLGLLAGGLLTAGVVWALSGLAAPLPAPARTAVILTVAGLAVLRDLGVLPVALPQNARQVPQHTLGRNWHGGAWVFGVELGTGVRTYLSASTPYVLAIALLASSPGLLSAAVPAGLGFGAGRALAPLLRRASGDGPAWDELARHRHRALKIGAAVAFAAVLAVRLLG